MHQNKRGFTLIEILAVVAIIGILSTVIIAATGSSKSKALDTKRQASLKSIVAALELYYAQNGQEYPPGAPTTIDQLQSYLSSYIPSLPQDPGGLKTYNGSLYYGYCAAASGPSGFIDRYVLLGRLTSLMTAGNPNGYCYASSLPANTLPCGWGGFPSCY